MPEYEVLLRRRAEKQLDRVACADHPRIVRAMLELEGDPRPRGCRKLFDNIYRIRIGDYRVVYKIDDERRAVAVGKIARRRENTCRDVEGLF